MTRLLTLLYRTTAPLFAYLVQGLLILTTPLVEKNPAKVLALRTPVVLSMARVVVLGFAIAVLRQIWRAGVAGWPDATLSIAVVLALPVVGALERVQPTDVLALTQTLVGRFGKGAVRPTGSVYPVPPTAPSKFDDHRSDGASTPDARGPSDAPIA